MKREVLPMGASDTATESAASLTAWATVRLADAGVASPRPDARWLVQHVLGRSPADMVLRAEQPVEPAQVRRVRDLVNRRCAREPLQLVVGSTEFRGHRVEMRPGVFVPRPETELLVEHTLDACDDPAVVVEPCTGTGAVACAIACEHPSASVVATDVCGAAVDLARHNAIALGVDGRVEVLRGDLLDPLPPNLCGRVDVLVCNPPYLASNEVGELEPEVADWDPARALVAGPTGHEVSDRLIGLAATWLRPGGVLAMELDERRVVEAAERARSAGLAQVRAVSDLTGRPRFVLAHRT